MGMHSDEDVKMVSSANAKATTAFQPDFTYEFDNFFHPLVGDLIERLNKESLADFFDPKFLKGLGTKFFKDFYDVLPNSAQFNLLHHPKEIDVSIGGSYANYNWELLFHFPFAIAVHLSKNQRFAEAQRWFHYIFDPTCNDTSVQPPARYWKFLKFRYAADTTPLDDQLALLSTSDDELKNDPAKQKLKREVLSSYQNIKDKPFRPHVVAQNRILSYQYAVVMKYMDNLIAWGDSLFRQDTIESINEATQIYVLAANLLGERPQRIPPRGAVGAKSFHQLKHDSKHGLDATGNAWADLEGKFPSLLSSPQPQGKGLKGAGPLFGVGRTLYFCIPRNEKLLAYWDTVADRLFKIRHCMNIEGVVRQLALFDPPLDPGMLVKAAAAGIDIGSIISGLNQPLSPLRAPLMIQKALELCGEVRSLGAALLSAIEKKEGEKLALLRQSHEVNIQQMMQEVRYLQWQQAQEATEALLKSRASPLERYNYYQRLLGLTPDSKKVPDTLELERPELSESTFDAVHKALVGKYDITIDTPSYPQRELKDEGTLRLLAGEYDDLNGHADRAFGFRTNASTSDIITAGLALIPNLNVKASYWGMGPEGHQLTGGSPLSKAGQAARASLAILADNEQSQGQNSSKTASYERRADEWLLQSNLAALDLMHIGRQIIGSLIAEEIARHEYENVKKQIDHAQEVYTTLQEKYTNEELYAWMQGETSRLYYEYYRFAFDIARKAEQTMKRELMRPEVDAIDFIKFNYWDGGRKGLLSGEALHLDLKRMELAYHEHNKREFELTKHVSLRQLNPVALLTLKATGSCEVTIPEWLFDLDCPCHYMRRLKSVSLSIPSVTGPYTSVNCTLSLLKSSLRRSPLLGDDYARQGSEDDRFVDYYGTIQSVVTSSANNDNGMFEINLRDERFLPFEGAGAESTWKLELPAEFRQFDYNTIHDVIFHVRYTARQGGAQLGGQAVANLQTLIEEANTSGLVQLFSLKHDFPSEWSRFVASDGNTDFKVMVKKTYFPYFVQGKVINIDKVELYTIKENELQPSTLSGVTVISLTQENPESELSLSAVDVQEMAKIGNGFVLLRYWLG